MWRTAIIELALENTFLVHAIFLVTAAHLRYLQPNEPRHHGVVLEQLAHALPAFRKALANPVRSQPGYRTALMAASMLLLQYSWESTPTVSDTVADNEGWNNLLILYTGVKNIVFEFWDMTLGGCQFTPHLIYSPRIAIDIYFQDSPVPADIKVVFDHCLNCTQIADDQGRDLSNCVDACQRLTAIWRAVRLGPQGLDKSGLLLDLARYLFTWPNMLSAGFRDLTSTEESRAQAILLYYLAAIVRLTVHCQRFWWMRQRAINMFESIFSRLKDRCQKCTGMARELLEEKDPV